VVVLLSANRSQTIGVLLSHLKVGGSASFPPSVRSALLPPLGPAGRRAREGGVRACAARGAEAAAPPMACARIARSCAARIAPPPSPPAPGAATLLTRGPDGGQVGGADRLGLTRTDSD
jgi:hypothetical protein